MKKWGMGPKRFRNHFSTQNNLHILGFMQISTQKYKGFARLHVSLDQRFIRNLIMIKFNSWNFTMIRHNFLCS